jgi:cytochrome oxidase assembly protein ShyY1
MYRFLFRPAWIGFHLLVVGAIVLMVNLGFWQLRRLDQRQAFNATFEARIDQPAAPIDDVLASIPPGGDAAAVRWRPATATGRYLPDEQIVVVNRSQNGRAGDNVVTPLELPDGRILLVTRGFVPLGQDAAPAPSGDVQVEGLLQPSQERRTGQLSDPATGELDEVQRIDIDRLAGQLPGEVVPVSLDLTTSSPPERGPFPEPLLRPEISEGPHLSYAVQWFIFAAAVALGWVLAVRRSIERHRHDLATISDRAATGPQPVPATSVDDGAAPAPR